VAPRDLPRYCEGNSTTRLPSPSETGFHINPPAPPEEAGLAAELEACAPEEEEEEEAAGAAVAAEEAASASFLACCSSSDSLEEEDELLKSISHAVEKDKTARTGRARNQFFIQS
jgi:hypothetical protein